eukprot:869795-Amphidinium_carterae.1
MRFNIGGVQCWGDDPDQRECNACCRSSPGDTEAAGLRPIVAAQVHQLSAFGEVVVDSIEPPDSTTLRQTQLEARADRSNVPAQAPFAGDGFPPPGAAEPAPDPPVLP